MVETLTYGWASRADSFMNPNQPQYRQIEERIIKYEYDPRKAAAMIEGLGYTKGNDGMFRSSDGQLLTLEVSTTAQLDIQPKTTFAVADSWRRLGVSANPAIIPNQRVQDQAFRVTFPGFSLIQQGNTHHDLLRFHSSEVALPETNFVGRNRSRYSNPQMDELLLRFQSTVPLNERIEVQGQILYHIADQLPAMGLFYGTEVTFIGNRVLNIQPASDAPTAWNAHEWAIR
jgi:peptide/nickel transport system substrate-binding protein